MTTEEHIKTVRNLIDDFCEEMRKRAMAHDASKLEEPEALAFKEAEARLPALTYGTPEYHEQLKALGPALEHHYKHNDHHPEHYPEGVWDMTLPALVEMFLDWRAATLRHEDGDIIKSIHNNIARFGLAPQLAAIFHNTAVANGWGEPALGLSKECAPQQFNRANDFPVGEVFDGYHTFDELYVHRRVLFLAFLKLLPEHIEVWKSRRHSDGELCFGGGWFIVAARLPTGQVSYHYEEQYWDDFYVVPDRAVPPAFDGHTADDVIKRIAEYSKKYL